MVTSPLVQLIFQLCWIFSVSGKPSPLFQLTESLMDKYGRGYARPVVHQSNTTYIHCKVIFSELQQMSTKKEYITVSAIVELTWMDEFLGWNPAEFHDIDVINLPASNVWTPDITLIESVDKDFVGLKPDSVVMVHSTGKITWKTPGIFKNSCRQNVRFFPFDSQVCEFQFASFSFDETEIELFTDQQYEDYSVISLLENVHWESKYYTICKESARRIGWEGRYSTLTYRILISRRHSFHVLFLIVPGILLSMVSPMVFHLPSISKQKVTFAVTNMLAFVVFHQLVTGTIPFRSDNKPILGVYLQVMIVIACVAAAATSIQIHIAFGDGPVSPWVEKLFLKTCSRFACQKWLQSKYQSRGSLKKRKGNNTEEILKLVTRERRRNHGNREQQLAKTSDDITSIQSTPKTTKNEQTPFYIRSSAVLQALKDAKNNHGCIKDTLVFVTDIFHQYMAKEYDTAIDDRDREVRLLICQVIDRFLFYLFFGVIMIITIMSFSFLVIGSTVDFDRMKGTLNVTHYLTNHM